MNRILVIRGGAIGDFVLTLPALRLLREGFPGAHIELLGYKHIIALGVLAGYADAPRSIEYAPLSSFFSAGGELAPELVEYFGSFQQIVSYLFDPKEIFATNLKRCGVRNLITGCPKISDQEHAARQLARPLQRLALFLDNAAAIIQLETVDSADHLTVAIHPGSGSETKNWPLERFAEVARELLSANEKLKLIVIGGEADSERVAGLKALLPNDRLKIAQNLPLPQLARLLSGCNLFLGHDSGISHLAAAVGVHCVLLFGPTDPAIWAPANPRVRVLRAPDGAMRGIEVAQVLEEVAPSLRLQSAGCISIPAL